MRQAVVAFLSLGEILGLVVSISLLHDRRMVDHLKVKKLVSVTNLSEQIARQLMFQLLDEGRSQLGRQGLMVNVACLGR